MLKAQNAKEASENRPRPWINQSRKDGPPAREAATAAVDALRAELEGKGVAVKEGSWGYRLLVVDDPDGNQLFFNYPSESTSGKNSGHEA